jgi:transcriptional regulator with XRE-family HTH domain
VNAPYAIRHLTQILREARLAGGDSQKELAERAGLGQNRLALIETGEVDLRASTLIQLARALDLELVLVPRRLLPVVQSLTAGPHKSDQQTEHRSVRRSPSRALRQILGHVAALERQYPKSVDLAQAKRAAKALSDMSAELAFASLQPLRRALFWFGRARTNRPEAEKFIAKGSAQLRELRQMVPQSTHLEQLPRPEPAAYGLEDELS